MLRLNVSYSSLHQARSGASGQGTGQLEAAEVGASGEVTTASASHAHINSSAESMVGLDVTLTVRPQPLNWWVQTATGAGTPPMLSHTITVWLMLQAQDQAGLGGQAEAEDEDEDEAGTEDRMEGRAQAEAGAAASRAGAAAALRDRACIHVRATIVPLGGASNT